MLRHHWRAVNFLHCKSLSPLPSSIPSPSIADTFCSFFSDKISSLRFTLQSLLALEVLQLLNSLPNKQCDLDPIPISLLKYCASVLLPVITKIINLLLSTGYFPLAFKHSLITPLLKKVNLGKENLSNYRPISNLSFLSKLTGRIVLARLNNYLSSNSLLNPHHSGFAKHHSTETLLVSLYKSLNGCHPTSFVSALPKQNSS